MKFSKYYLLLTMHPLSLKSLVVYFFLVRRPEAADTGIQSEISQMEKVFRFLYILNSDTFASVLCHLRYLASVLYKCFIGNNGNHNFSV